ncbi:MAG TPA: hypothetical protein VD969_18190 [Symbiobacteriaceae bacterium]|nr:hypothetical protein [Symbiobacteriaceae bacterium]
MYEGEVFTFRSDRAPRTAAAVRPQRPPAPDFGRAEALAAAERISRLEATVLRLEESLTHLTGAVQHLAERLQEAEALPPPPAAAAEQRAVLPKVSVQLMKEERPAPPPSDVKVTLFGSSTTEAILGQVKVTHNG